MLFKTLLLFQVKEDGELDSRVCAFEGGNQLSRPELAGTMRHLAFDPCPIPIIYYPVPNKRTLRVG